MPTTPAITTTVKITARDINGNNVAKTFNSVNTLSFDYIKGMVNIVDLIQGSFYFPITPLTTITHTITSGVGGVTTVVMS